MSVDVREVKGVLIVRPGNRRVTAVSGANEFREALDKALTAGHLAVAVDLTGVEYADSTMIGALISAFKNLHQHGGLICLFNVGSELREFFRQTVLDRVIEIRKDEQSAIDLFDGRTKKTGKRKSGLRRLFR